MIIIGINGNPGAGKTTVSNMILQNCNKKVIHLDFIFDGVKDMLPKDSIKKYDRTNEEMKILNRDSMFFKISHSKHLIEQYKRLKKIYANKFLKNEIKKALKENIDYLIVEGSRLEEYDILYLMSYLIFVEACELDRINRIEKRDGKYSYLILKNHLNFLKNINLDKYDFILSNIGTLEDLNEKCIFISNVIKDKVKQKYKI